MPRTDELTSGSFMNAPIHGHGSQSSSNAREVVQPPDLEGNGDQATHFSLDRQTRIRTWTQQRC